MSNTAIGSRIRSARIGANLCRDLAGSRIGVSARTISHYENGDTKIIPPDVIARMARVYRDPALKEEYCQSECPLGRGRCAVDTTASVERSILDAHMYDTGRLDKALAELSSIARDGIVDERERGRFEQVVKEIEDRASQLRSLLISAARLEGAAAHEEAAL